MWLRLTRLLRCPCCRSALQAAECCTREESRVEGCADAWLTAGYLTCATCRTWFPIIHGVPVLLPYSTAAHDETARRIAPPPGHSAPRGTPVKGEQLVMKSFSTEWNAYDYDGVIWEMNYADHERRFLAELGAHAPADRRGDRLFLEIGCGLGITTAMAQKNFGGEAIGVDLSQAAWRAAADNRMNPNLHFVQASVFALPFAAETFDIVYTRGVLHHTYSTHEAFKALAPCCKDAGVLYVWVYGSKSINDNLFRRGVYAIEVVMRAVLNRCPQWLATASLAPWAFAYVAFNHARRVRDGTIQPYNYRRALHAARDRFTPEFAHRQDADEVSRWFREAGFDGVETVDWRTMPTADHDDYRRNTGVRGRRSKTAGREAQESPSRVEAQARVATRA